ncbi:MAG: helix-turn-helix domain-containing protein [Chitinophagaceae bacterium]|nr:helix-turn-helix domain-containing protein [Chitinophagaceae bacterium]
MDRFKSNDPNFLRRAANLVFKHIDDDQFAGSQLAEQLFLSREQTHRKIKQITSVSTGRFIRYIRILQALVHLQSGHYSVSEIGFKVGFGDPAWFSKCFREEMGASPMEIKKNGLGPEWRQLPIFSFYTLPEVNELLASHGIFINTKTIHKTEETLPRRKKWHYLIPVMMVVCVILVLITSNKKAETKSVIRPGTRIAVLPYNNQTGDSSMNVIGDIAGSWITSRLSEIDSFQVVPWFTVRQYQQYVGVTPGDPQQKPLFNEIVSAQYLVNGDYFLKGSEIYFNTRFIDANTSAVIYDFPIIRGSKDSVMTLIEDIRVRIAGLIMNLDAVKLGKLIPPNIIAYRYYLKGMEELNTGLYFTNARKYFEMAVDCEPNFVEPRIFLTWTYGGVAQDSMISMMQDILKTPGITRYERKICETWSAVFQRQHKKALEMALQSLQSYPKDYYFNMLAGYLAKAMFKPRLSISVLNQLTEPGQSDFGMIWHYFKVFNYTESLLMLDRTGDAVAYLKNISDNHYNLEIPRLLINATVSSGGSKEDVDQIIDSIARTKVHLLQFEYGLDEDKLYSTWYLSAAWEFSLRGADTSARYFAKKGLLKLEKGNGDAYGFDKVDALFLMGNYEVAARYIRQKLQERPTNEDLWVYLAQAEAASGNYQVAFRILKRFENKSLIKFRRNEHPYQKDYIKARLYAILEQEGKAVAFLKSAIEKGQLMHYCDYRRDIFLRSLRNCPDFVALTAPD